VAVVALAAVGLWSLSFLMVGQNNFSGGVFAPLDNVYQTIQDQFYRAAELDQQTLVEDAARGLVESLDDPYSNYLSAADYERFNRSLEGEFVGVGIHIGIRDNRLTIIAPITDSPAHQAGARAGDVILRIDQMDTEGITMDEAVSLLRGKEGTEVLMEVRHRDGSVEVLSVIRAVIHVPTVETSIVADGTIGYVQLFTFNENASADIRQALDEFHSAGVEGVVFDLRNNGGGFLSEAIRVSSQFIDSGIVVSTNAPSGSRDRYSEGNRWDNLPVAVLINGATASASEIVAGAIQDHEMGILIGQQSFGKGVVQTLIPLPGDDGAVLRLTTSEYLTPLGRHVHGDGLTPDIIIADTVMLMAEADAKLRELKYSLYTRAAHDTVGEMRELLTTIEDRLQNNDGDADQFGTELMTTFKATKGMLLEASDGELTEALTEVESTLTKLEDALVNSALNTAIEWILDNQGTRCPCEVSTAAE
jgi:carboxyl-terminal processing protease